MDWFYRCSECGTRYEITPEATLCPVCSSLQRPAEPLRGILEVVMESNARRSAGQGTDTVAARVADGDLLAALPVEREYFPPIPVGNTPLWEPSRLRDETGLPRLYLKDDTGNPTKSFKDRASFLVAAFARKHRVDAITVASTGNAASSMAGVGAAAGLAVTIFVPEDAPEAKLVQCLQYGATVHRVAGGYTQAFRDSLAYTAEHGGINRNTAYQPLTIEGKKTVALEIWRDLGRVPDHVFVPTGDGVILSGVAKGFADLVALGLTDRVPVLHIVQARGSAAIAAAIAADGVFAPLSAATVADSIAVDVPAGGYYALRELGRYRGVAHIVTDEAILAAQHRLARLTGLFAEPAAAAALAGLETALSEKVVAADESVVLLITGSGLKDIRAAARGMEDA